MSRTRSGIAPGSTCKAATELYIVDGGGHTWPGKPEPRFEAQFGHATTDIDATALMFAFFFGHWSGMRRSVR